LELVKRGALIVYAKEKMLHWVNQLDSFADEQLTIEEINTEPTVFLIPEYEDEENAFLYIEENKNTIFKNLLYEWNENEELNLDISKENFYDWFDFLATPIVNDLVNTQIIKETI